VCGETATILPDRTGGLVFLGLYGDQKHVVRVIPASLRHSSLRCNRSNRSVLSDNASWLDGLRALMALLSL
ncbi:MAG: hypothetical protein QW122_04350, partial [Archaeoglobaceae archaeon]